LSYADRLVKPGRSVQQADAPGELPYFWSV
jgi:hypothetical protein